MPAFVANCPMHLGELRALQKPSKAGRVVRKQLSDGTFREYRYAPYQAPEKPAGDTMRGLMRAYEASTEFKGLALATRTQYLTYMRHWLLAADAAPKLVTRRQVLEARDAIAETRGNGAATAFGRVTSAMFGWAVDRGWLENSPAQRMRALPGGHLPAWSDAMLAAAMAKLPEALRRVVVLGLYTGQRRGDLCAMTWAAYDGGSIRVRQGKTGTILSIPAHPVLRAELAAWRAERPDAVQILQSPRRTAWNPQNLSQEMQDALQEIGMPPGFNVHGLRKAAARRLAEAGCTVSEIAAITGHKSLQMVQLYTESVDQERLAGAAVVKLTTQIQPRKK